MPLRDEALRGLLSWLHHMSTRSRKRDVERSVTPTEFITKLRRIADALEAGKSFTIQVRGERLRVPKEADLSIEHEREGGSEELELQLKWSRE
jgi:amphi-Trp domain-containing protein